MFYKTQNKATCRPPSSLMLYMGVIHWCKPHTWNVSSIGWATLNRIFLTEATPYLDAHGMLTCNIQLSTTIPIKYRQLNDGIFYDMSCNEVRLIHALNPSPSQLLNTCKCQRVWTRLPCYTSNDVYKSKVFLGGGYSRTYTNGTQPTWNSRTSTHGSAYTDTFYGLLHQRSVNPITGSLTRGIFKSLLANPNPKYHAIIWLS